MRIALNEDSIDNERQLSFTIETAPGNLVVNKVESHRNSAVRLHGIKDSPNTTTVAGD